MDKMLSLYSYGATIRLPAGVWLVWGTTYGSPGRGGDATRAVGVPFDDAHADPDHDVWFYWSTPFGDEPRRCVRDVQVSRPDGDAFNGVPNKARGVLLTTPDDVHPRTVHHPSDPAAWAWFGDAGWQDVYDEAEIRAELARQAEYGCVWEETRFVERDAAYAPRRCATLRRSANLREPIWAAVALHDLSALRAAVEAWEIAREETRQEVKRAFAREWPTIAAAHAAGRPA